MSNYADVEPRQILSEEERSQYVLVDVRTDEEYKQGRIPNSVHIPMDQLDWRFNELDVCKEKNILFICRSGVRSAIAAEYLFEKGFLHVFNLSGGLLEWTGSVEM